MKLIKRFMSLALSLCMIMALCFCSFADDTVTDALKTEDVTLSIKEPVAGHTYKVYQLLSGDVAGADKKGSGTLSNITAGKNLKDVPEDETAKAEYVKNVIEALSEKSHGALGNKAYEYLDKTPGEVATFSKDGDTSAKVKPGYYIIVDETYVAGEDPKPGEDTFSRYLVAVVGDTEVTPKTEIPSIEKTITNEGKNAPIDGNYKKTNTAAVGDIINFQIKGAVPNYDGYTYYYYVINDTLDAGLTFDKDSVKVTVDGTEIAKGTAYYVYTENIDGKTFEIAFENIKDYAVGKEILVTYSATVNADAEVGTTANKNTATLTYSNKPGDSGRGDKEDIPDKPNEPGKGTPKSDRPTGETPKQITKTYVTELNIFKVDENGNRLQGAEFTLQGDNLNQIVVKTEYTFAEAEDGEYYALTDGSYTKTAPTEREYDTDGVTVKVESNYTDYKDATSEDDGVTITVSKKYSRTVSTVTETKTEADSKVSAEVDKNGNVTFKGLMDGTYTLSETKTPTGYNTIPDITFTISATQTGSNGQEGGSITWTSSNEKVTEDGGILYSTIENVKGTVLPSTGGIGTTIFYVIGSVMVLGAAVLLITKKRMSSEN